MGGGAASGGCFGRGPLCGEAELGAAVAALEYFSVILITDDPLSFKVLGLTPE